MLVSNLIPGPAVRCLTCSISAPLLLPSRGPRGEIPARCERRCLGRPARLPLPWTQDLRALPVNAATLPCLRCRWTLSCPTSLPSAVAWRGDAGEQAWTLTLALWHQSRGRSASSLAGWACGSGAGPELLLAQEGRKRRARFQQCPQLGASEGRRRLCVPPALPALRLCQRGKNTTSASPVPARSR